MIITLGELDKGFMDTIVELAEKTAEDLGRIYGLKQKTRIGLEDAAKRLLQSGLSDSEVRDILDDLVNTILIYEVVGDDD